jgi:hypothetical protein
MFSYVHLHVQMQVIKRLKWPLGILALPKICGLTGYVIRLGFAYRELIHLGSYDKR